MPTWPLLADHGAEQGNAVDGDADEVTYNLLTANDLIGRTWVETNLLPAMRVALDADHVAFRAHWGIAERKALTMGVLVEAVLGWLGRRLHPTPVSGVEMARLLIEGGLGGGRCRWLWCNAATAGVSCSEGTPVGGGGYFFVNVAPDRQERLSRVVCWLLRGPPPGGWEASACAMHVGPCEDAKSHCRRRRCMLHLRWGTHAENMQRRSASKARKAARKARAGAVMTAARLGRRLEV